MTTNMTDLIREWAEIPADEVPVTLTREDRDALVRLADGADALHDLEKEHFECNTHFRVLADIAEHASVRLAAARSGLRRFADEGQWSGIRFRMPDGWEHVCWMWRTVEKPWERAEAALVAQTAERETAP